MDSVFQSLRKFESWCREDALPYWAEHGLDPKGGGYERLNMDGAPDVHALRRVRVQARQAYVYAHAGALGWYKDARAVSDHFWSYVTSNGFQGEENGSVSCAHLLNPDGSLHDGSRDTYAQAFVILAGAWRYIAFQDEQALKIAKQVLTGLDATVKADNGGWLEGMPAKLPRRQNPHMHMFEALLSLYDASGDLQYLQRADEIFQLFLTTFYDKNTGVIIEFFDQDWSRAVHNGGPVEPGHMMEWSWLLRGYANRGGQGVGDIASRLYSQAVSFGQHADLGLLFDNINVATSVTSNTLRSWQQTEFIKAGLAQAIVSGDMEYARQAAGVTQRLMNTYLNVPQRGGWADTLGKDGKIIPGFMEASTFYHLFCAAAEANAFTDKFS